MSSKKSIGQSNRRELLKLLSLGSAAIFFGHDRIPAFGAGAKTIAADLPACIVRPEHTEGPYFIDEKLDRSDIRSDPADRSIKPGIPLRLEFNVSRVAGATCAPLDGAVVDVWHCDALGVYSDVRDAGFDTRGKKFLRGYQTTGANGVARFTTIYPGWYPGRAVHIHFKIRSAIRGGRPREFTSQLYFDETVSDQIFKQSPYSGKNGPRTRNDADFLFRNGGNQLMPSLAKDARGFSATFAIGLRIA